MTERKRFAWRVILWCYVGMLACILLATCRQALGADSLIDCPEKSKPYRMIDVKIIGDWEQAIYQFEPDAEVNQRPTPDGKGLTWVAPPGTYTIRAMAANFTAKKLAQDKRVVVIEGTVPVPPTPPDPPTPPVPPVPPTPVDPPIPQAGLRMLIIEKQTDRGKLPKGQVDILTSTSPDSVVGYAIAHCVKGPDGKTPDYRIADVGSDFSRDTPIWKAARAKFAELKVAVPGWLVSNGSTGIGGPLPATPAEALKILQQHTSAAEGK